MDINREISDFLFREYCRDRDEAVANGGESFAYRTWELAREQPRRLDAVLRHWTWSFGERDGGQWFLYEPDGMTGPYPSELEARQCYAVLLCLDCAASVVAGVVPTECEDDCGLAVSHGGLCHRQDEGGEACSRCGDAGFLRQFGMDELIAAPWDQHAVIRGRGNGKSTASALVLPSMRRQLEHERANQRPWPQEH